jgi:hypothetical protein
VDVTWVKVAFVPIKLIAVRSVIVEEENKAVPLRIVALLVERFSAVKLVEEAVEAKKFVLVVFVPVALVQIRFVVVAVSVTFKLVVTKFPVEVPPPNVMVEVATFPCSNTCCKVGVADPLVGQLLPSARQTAVPLTVKAPLTSNAPRIVDVVPNPFTFNAPCENNPPP